MGFRRMPIEETTYDNSHIGAMRGISDLVREEEAIQGEKRESAARDRRRVEEEGREGLFGGIQRGVENFAAGAKENRRERREEERLARTDARADRQVAMAEEEFTLRKPELQAQAKTADRRAALGIEGQEQGIKTAQAQGRQATVAADSQEREEAIMNAQATYADAQPGETNRMYLARLEREEKTSQLKLAQAQLEEQIAGRPMREKLMGAQIGAAQAGAAASRAATEGQTLANAKAREEEDVRRWTAIAQNPTPQQMANLPAGLASAVNSGQIPPEKVPLVLAEIKDRDAKGRMQQALLNQTDDRYKKDLNDQFVAEDKAKLYTDNIAILRNSLDTNSANAILNDAGARERFAAALEGMGMQAEADNVRNKLSDLSDTLAAILPSGEGDKFGAVTDNLMRSYLNKATALARTQFKTPAERKNPAVQALLTNLDSIGTSSKTPYKVFGGPNAGAPTMNAGGQPSPAGQMQPGQFQLGGQRFDTGGNMGGPAQPLAPIPGTVARPRPPQVGKR